MFKVMNNKDEQCKEKVSVGIIAHFLPEKNYKNLFNRASKGLNMNAVTIPHVFLKKSRFEVPRIFEKKL
jgi:hypothetical protein